MPLVSVITPICNVEKYLAQCLDSLCAQTLQDIEFICIDDGSTDSSADILREYEARDSRIKAIYKVNSGYGATMNLGLQQATGDYIGIVESDDFVAPNAFERLLSIAFENGEPDVVKANFYEFSEGKGEIFRENYPDALCGHVFSPLAEEGKDLIVSNPTIWSAIYRRSFLEEKGIRFLETPGASYQDTGFVFKSFLAADTVLLVHDAYLRYRVDNSGSSVKSKDKVFQVCGEFESIEGFLAAMPDRETQLLPALVRKKYDTYVWNYRRLSEEGRQAFLGRFSQEMSSARSAGMLDKSLYTKRKWKDLNCLIDSPVSFANRFTARESGTDKPKVSVVLAVGNDRKRVGGALDSLSEQTLFDVEVVCVNAGSSDGAWDVVLRRAERDLRMCVVGGGGDACIASKSRNEESSVAFARAWNEGLAHARGEYVALADCNCRFGRKACERAYAEAHESDAIVVLFASEGDESMSWNEKGKMPFLGEALNPARKDEQVGGVTSHVKSQVQFSGPAYGKLFNRESVVLFDGIHVESAKVEKPGLARRLKRFFRRPV